MTRAPPSRDIAPPHWNDCCAPHSDPPVGAS